MNSIFDDSFKQIEIDIEDIQNFIIECGLGENGLAVQARMGCDPDRAYFEKLLEYLRILFDSLRESDFIERELAFALYSLGHHVGDEYRSWMKKTSMRETLLDDIMQLEAAIESIFNNIWIEVM